MRAVPLSLVRPGMRLGRTLFVGGRPYLRRGAEIRASYLPRLSRLGIRALFIEETNDDIQSLDELISDETRTAAFGAVAKAMRWAHQGTDLPMDDVTLAADRIIDEILIKRDVLVHLSELRTVDDYTFAHSVSVCALAVLAGLQYGLRAGDLKTLAVGALLHDIGKMRVPGAIWTRSGALTAQEFEQVQAHAHYGFELLRRQHHISLLAAHVAYQHHERYDGSGYPRGLVGTEIHLYARITAIADVYDALTSQEHPYRSALSPMAAAEFLVNGRGVRFDPVLVNGFLQRIALYPPGNWVRLSNGEVGVVVEYRKAAPRQPRVKMMHRPTQEVVDLATTPDLRIVEVSATDPDAEERVVPIPGR
ncbi:MAG TPA: HD-GYP domain-containing protein [Limnochordia bacterium]